MGGSLRLSGRNISQIFFQASAFDSNLFSLDSEGLTFFLISAYIEGNPKRLLYPTNSEGNNCIYFLGSLPF